MNIVQCIATLDSKNGGPTECAVNINYNFLLEKHNAKIITMDATSKVEAEDKNELVSFSGFIVYRYVKLLKYLLTNPIDLMYIHGLHLPVSWLSGIIARFRKIPYVVQLHGTMEPYEFARHSLRKNVFHFTIGINFLKNAYFIIAASTSEKTNIQEKIANLNVIVNPLGVRIPNEMNNVSIDRVRLKEHFFTTSFDNRVLFLGRLAKKKHPELLLELVVQFHDIHLVMAGPEDYWSEDELLRLIPENFHFKVSFPKQVDQLEKWWLLQNVKIFLLPSDNENFAITVAEAMCAGTLCVVSHNVATSQFVSDLDSGIVLQDLSFNSLRESVEYLIEKQDRSEIRLERIKKAQHIFDWRIFTKRILEILNGSQ